MHIKITFDIEGESTNVTNVLAGALQIAGAADTAQEHAESAPKPKASTKPKAAPKTTEEPAPKPEPPKPEEPKAAAPKPEEPKPAPQPETEEPKPAAASSDAITLTQLRKRFTEISKSVPGARQKVSEILVAAGAHNLQTLPEAQYAAALAELEGWANAQAS